MFTDAGVELLHIAQDVIDGFRFGLSVLGFLKVNPLASIRSSDDTQRGPFRRNESRFGMAMGGHGKAVDEPATALPLYIGVNVISGKRDRDMVADTNGLGRAIKPDIHYQR